MISTMLPKFSISSDIIVSKMWIPGKFGVLSEILARFSLDCIIKTRRECPQNLLNASEYHTETDSCRLRGAGDPEMVGSRAKSDGLGSSTQWGLAPSTSAPGMVGPWARSDSPVFSDASLGLAHSMNVHQDGCFGADHEIYGVKVRLCNQYPASASLALIHPHRQIQLY